MVKVEWPVNRSRGLSPVPQSFNLLLYLHFVGDRVDGRMIGDWWYGRKRLWTKWEINPSLASWDCVGLRETSVRLASIPATCKIWKILLWLLLAFILTNLNRKGCVVRISWHCDENLECNKTRCGLVFISQRYERSEHKGWSFTRKFGKHIGNYMVS
jgi:hypothetical protein